MPWFLSFLNYTCLVHLYNALKLGHDTKTISETSHTNPAFLFIHHTKTKVQSVNQQQTVRLTALKQTMAYSLDLFTSWEMDHIMMYSIFPVLEESLVQARTDSALQPQEGNKKLIWTAHRHILGGKFKDYLQKAVPLRSFRHHSTCSVLYNPLKGISEKQIGKGWS